MYNTTENSNTEGKGQAKEEEKSESSYETLKEGSENDNSEDENSYETVSEESSDDIPDLVPF